MNQGDEPHSDAIDHELHIGDTVAYSVGKDQEISTGKILSFSKVNIKIAHLTGIVTRHRSQVVKI